MVGKPSSDGLIVPSLIGHHPAFAFQILPDDGNDVGGGTSLGMECHGEHEYVRGDIHTNTVEGYYSIFKRGMKGIYQHCSEKHLHRYLAEFDFQYSNREARGVNDVARADRTLKGIVGKRLTYRPPHN